MHFRVMLFVFICFFSGGAAQASTGLLYDCTMTDLKRSGGWITEKLVMTFDASGNITVYDALISSISSVPIAADLRRKSAHKMTVTWELLDLVSSNNQRTPYFNFRAVVHNNGKVTVFAQPEGYHNRFTARGNCVVHQVE